MFKRMTFFCLLAAILTFVIPSISVACTVFTVSSRGSVFFGNNEDYSNPNTYYWIETSQDGRYGGVYFGYDNFWPQGGINEKGLAFDINSLEETPLNPHPELPSFSDYEGYSILRNCKTVEEAIEHVQKFNWGSAMWGQIHVADSNGEAVIIGPGLDGELSFTRKPVGDGFLVSTNFNMAEPDEKEHSCQRYDTTTEMLKEVGNEEELSLNYIRDVLDAAHIEGAYSNTLYSTVYDLRNGDIFIYYFHQFEEVVELNVIDEILSNKGPVLLSSLFSPSVLERASSEQSEYLVQFRVRLALAILGIISALGLLFFLFRSWRKRRLRTRA